jgi:hypothetical protein
MPWGGGAPERPGGPAMTAFADIRAQLDQTCDLIGGFRRSAEAGTVIDLHGLDQSVEAMCESIARLPADQRPPLKDALVALLDEMNALVATLETRKRDASEELKGVSSRQRAVTAYGKGAAPGKTGRNKPTK